MELLFLNLTVIVTFQIHVYIDIFKYMCIYKHLYMWYVYVKGEREKK